ncbi:MAG: hypothetical protein SGPRY_012791 [Prymnesium sp.]
MQPVQLAAGTMAARNSPAQHIITVLMPKMGLRVQRTKVAHAMAGASNTYNGKAMWDELVALRANVGLLEETRDHDRVVELMCDTALADGCPTQVFPDKVKELMRDHIPWLERPLLGDALSKFIVKLIPEKNASEGRLLIRELAAAGTLNNHSAVIRRCVAIVRESESAATRAVGLATRAQCYGRATTPAAAAALATVAEAKDLPPAGGVTHVAKKSQATGEVSEAATARQTGQEEIEQSTARGDLVQGRNVHLRTRGKSVLSSTVERRPIAKRQA